MIPKRRNSRASSTDLVAEAILALRLPHPVRVAVDGRTASGKTSFADRLAVNLERSGRGVIRASIDGFHHPRALRYRQGRLSPDSYYEDARDLEAVRTRLLGPLGPCGDLSYVTATFDLNSDQPLIPNVRRAHEQQVLIVDGTFLQRPELRPAWDFVIFLNVSEEEAHRRAIHRGSPTLGGSIGASEIYIRRYGPAFARYEAECRPLEKADFVIDDSSRF